MANWNNDTFMSDWDSKYVSTNLEPGAALYNKDFFLGINSELASTQPELHRYSYAIVVSPLVPLETLVALITACCAVGRADVVGRFFDDITATSDQDESQTIFLRLREAITIIFPYLGMPTCIPACYGMIGVIQRKGREYASTRVLRSKTITEQDVENGTQLPARIYKGVGNSEIFGLMDQYFTDLFNTSTVVTWGYLIARANQEVFEPEQSHFIVASAIIALGATRQSKSHIKATLGMGNSVDCVKAVVSAIARIAEWAGRPIASLNVDELAQ